MITTELKETIELLRTKYTLLIQDLPKIESIEESTDPSCIAQFLTEDLYNKKYILYINPNIEQECLQFKENILFHEFTHMADSIKYSDLSLKDFRDFMFIYSEVHASEIQMDRMLETQKRKPYSLDKRVVHGGYIQLKNWMDQTLNHVVKEFTLPETSIPQSTSYDLRELFYFIGYLKSLEKHNIAYTYDYSQIPHLKDAFGKITNLLLNEESNPDIIILHYKELELEIKKSLLEHRRKVLAPISKTITDCDDTISDTIAFLKERIPNFDEEEFRRKLTKI